jgi:transcriptional regulator with XRE-family HTH domain
MNNHHEITPENLRPLRSQMGVRQSYIAELLGIQQSAVSRVESGKREITSAEKQVLEFFFFGKLPDRIPAVRDDLARGIMEFTESEWRVITILAQREGNKVPTAWIADKIRGYLENNPSALAANSELNRQTSVPTSTTGKAKSSNSRAV